MYRYQTWKSDQEGAPILGMYTTKNGSLTFWTRRAHLCPRIAPVLRNGHIYAPSDLVRNIGCAVTKLW